MTNQPTPLTRTDYEIRLLDKIYDRRAEFVDNILRGYLHIGGPDAAASNALDRLIERGLVTIDGIHAVITDAGKAAWEAAAAIDEGAIRAKLCNHYDYIPESHWNDTWQELATAALDAASVEGYSQKGSGR